MRTLSVLPRISTFALTIAILACHGEITEPSDIPDGHAALLLRASVAGTSIAGLTIEVRADDIPQPIVQNIDVVDDVGEGTIIVPAGSDRRVVVRAFNRDGIETHRGEATIDVVEGTNPTLEIILEPLFGEVPVVVRIGSWTLAIEPDEVQIKVTDHAQLTATLQDANGNLVTRPIVWGSTHPVVASVDQNGLVTALSAGETEIVASFGSTRATASVVVLALDWASVVAGERHVCGLDVDGAAYCWGSNDAGQLGIGATGGMSTLPVAVAGEHTFQSIAPGGLQTCGVTTDGDGLCWGRSIGGSAFSNVPLALPGDHTWDTIEMGIFHACGVTAGGEALCWGYGGQGRLGTGNELSSAIPTSVAGGHSWVQVSAGRDHTCGVTVDGDGYCWGSGAQGQLGDGAGASSSVPVQVQVADPVDAEFQLISAGGFHSCSLHSTGAVYCWGWGNEGQLGNGAVQTSLTPVSVNVVASSLDAGGHHTCAVQSADVLCWGYGGAGQLGNGQTAGIQATPVLVEGEIDFLTVTTSGSPFAFSGSVSRGTSCGLSSDASVFCWGSNRFGEIGDATTNDRSRPVPTRDPVE